MSWKAGHVMSGRFWAAWSEDPFSPVASTGRHGPAPQPISRVRGLIEIPLPGESPPRFNLGRADDPWRRCRRARWVGRRWRLQVLVVRLEHVLEAGVEGEPG